MPVMNKTTIYIYPTGVVIGTDICGLESPAVTDPGFWVVDIGKLYIDQVHSKTNYNVL